MILVSGGAGYIGSHTCVELIEAGYEIVVADNLINSSEEAVRRVEKITGKKVPFVKCELCDPVEVKELFRNYPNIDAVIHFAGLKAVGESVAKPLEYYTNNLVNTLMILNVMRDYGVKNFVFSSSATVYGDPASVPIREDFPTGGTTNPYGTTKLFIERILMDYCKAEPSLNVALLRYFNPIGAHESGLIGEDPKGIPNNLLPYVAQVAVGKLECVGVFGDDYDTPDGTGVRDYIHVVDLARGHVAALDWMGGKVGTGEPFGLGSIQGEAQADGSRRGVGIFNLGTGKGSSVLDVIHAFERACGKTIPYEIKPRRAGDIATNYAACDKAQRELGWVAQYDLDRMCSDSWRWQSMNPDGYATEA